MGPWRFGCCVQVLCLKFVWAWNLCFLFVHSRVQEVKSDPVIGRETKQQSLFHWTSFFILYVFCFYLIVRNCVFVQTVSIHFSRTKRESKSHSWARNIAHVNDLVFNHFCRGLGLGWGIHYLSWFWAGVWPCERAGHPVGIYTHP